MSAPIFGWELLLKSVEGEISNSQDVLFCFAHLVLIANGFRCVGLGDSKLLDGSETKTESLPQGWSANYAVRYVSQGRLYLLRGTNVNDALMLNLIRVQERTVSVQQLPVLAVAQMSGPLEQAIPNYEELANNIKKQLIDKIATSAKFKDDASQTDPSRTSTSRLIDMQPNPAIFPISPLLDMPHLGVGRNDLDPFGVGRADLDPLGALRRPDLRSGGGMLFEPPSARGIGPRGLGVPLGSVPPGARFDPFRPPGADDDPQQSRRFRGDDLPPPGFDDMFM